MTAPIKELLRAKRDGRALGPGELRAIAAGLADGTVTDAQAGAFAMAVVFRGLDRDELPVFTLAMRDTGQVLDWSDLGRPVLDKHSTGGVGDKVSLILAPILAACGAAVPMLSGRGLGHTGGTLDKMEAIPGYDTRPDIARLREVVEQVGCAIVGQTGELAPADGRLYAVRDATATVESIPLIVSSILSKKLAAGLQALVLDVKHGSGAFMPNLADAERLARMLVDVGKAAGLPTSALLTDMNQVLGRTAGNALEVRESIDVLLGHPEADERLVEVTLALARTVLRMGGLPDADPDQALRSGAAAQRFAAMVAALGGPADLLANPSQHLPEAPVVLPVYPELPGVVERQHVRELGLVVTELGGGRHAEGDAVDHAVGLDRVAALGEAVGEGGRPLCHVHARDEPTAEAAIAPIRAAFVVGDVIPTVPPIITEELR